MSAYLSLVVLLRFLVDSLLLMAANRLCGFSAKWRNCAIAGLLSGAYAGICMLPGCQYMGNLTFRLLSASITVLIAFGWKRSTLRRGTMFLLLHLAVEALAMGVDGKSFVTLALSAAGIALLYIPRDSGVLGTDKYQPVELCWRGKKLKLTALMDTGNTLHDPITGNSVLVVSMDTGCRLGISREMICDPIGTLAQGNLPGARLVSYRSLGNPSGMLLMLKMEKVLLNGRAISPLVAFAQEEIGEKRGYQALAGGAL